MWASCLPPRSADLSQHAFSGPRDEPIASADILRFIPRGAPQVGPVAQWLEPAAHNGLVAGSSPARPTSTPWAFREFLELPFPAPTVSPTDSSFDRPLESCGNPRISASGLLSATRTQGAGIASRLPPTTFSCECVTPRLRRKKTRPGGCGDAGLRDQQGEEAGQRRLP